MKLKLIEEYLTDRDFIRTAMLVNNIVCLNYDNIHLVEYNLNTDENLNDMYDACNIAHQISNGRMYDYEDDIFYDDPKTGWIASCSWDELHEKICQDIFWIMEGFRHASATISNIIRDECEDEDFLELL